jgi:lipopolysaccharide biosynthesis glycosyltransferase
VGGAGTRGRLPPRLDAAQRHLVGHLKERIYRVTAWPAFQSLVMKSTPMVLPRFERADAAARERVLAWGFVAWWAPVFIRMLGHIQDRDSVVRLGELAASTDGLSPHVVAALLTSFCDVGLWPEAGSLVEASSDLLWSTRNQALWSATIRYLCLSQRIPEAHDLLARWGDRRTVPSASSGTVAVLLSTSRDWDGVIDFLADRVAQHMSIGSRQLLESVEHAARLTHRYRVVVALLDRSLQDAPAKPVAYCRARLLLEVAFLAATGVRDDGPSQPIDIPAIADRLAWWQDLLTGHPTYERSPSRQDERTVTVEGGVFLCTDRNYLVGTSVAVWALLRHNPGLRTTWPLTVMCAADAVDLAEDIFARLGAASGVPIRVVNVDSLLSDHRFRTNWGIFTAHPGLTEATYYRLFAARWLVDQGMTGRAVYLDADTIPGPGIRRLFESDLHGQPIAARTDAPLPGVRQAAATLGIDLAQYFNAGVMVFDLAHAATHAALTRAIAFAREHPDALTFFDQCALNVGFAGLRAPLPDSFNYLIPPEPPATRTVGEPVVRHFIGPPKPWDPMYIGDNCRPWLAELAALGRVLPPEDLGTLLGLPFRSLPS